MKAWHEHSAEIMSIDWNNLVKDQFVTASWDHTLKVVSHPHHINLSQSSIPAVDTRPHDVPLDTARTLRSNLQCDMEPLLPDSPSHLRIRRLSQSLRHSEPPTRSTGPCYPGESDGDAQLRLEQI